MIDFYSMQYSLLLNVLIVGLGSLFFFLTAIWIVQDKLKAETLETEMIHKGSHSHEKIDPIKKD